jgi:hypothetical protein
VIFDFEMTGFMDNDIDNKSGRKMDQFAIEDDPLVMRAASSLSLGFFDAE